MSNCVAHTSIGDRGAQKKERSVDSGCNHASSCPRIHF